MGSQGDTSNSVHSREELECTKPAQLVWQWEQSQSQCQRWDEGQRWSHWCADWQWYMAQEGAIPTSAIPIILPSGIDELYGTQEFQLSASLSLFATDCSRVNDLFFHQELLMSPQPHLIYNHFQMNGVILRISSHCSILYPTHLVRTPLIWISDMPSLLVCLASKSFSARIPSSPPS